MSREDWEPKIIADVGDLRLVRQRREQSWGPNAYDVSLERRSKDAMGNERWMPLEDWYLTPKTLGDGDLAARALFLLISERLP